MCGRYTLIMGADELARRFQVDTVQAKITPRYNAAPTQMMPIITNEQPKAIIAARWGLIPHWAKEEKIGYRMTNARAESVAIKPAFRQSFVRKRCLVLADGFYEWKKTPDEKLPYRITRKDEDAFAFAGLWDAWKNPAKPSETVHSYTIITTDANSFMAKIHDRMPVILSPGHERDWLSADPAAALKLLKPCPSTILKAYRVSTLVNSPKNDTAAVLKEA